MRTVRARSRSRLEASRVRLAALRGIGRDLPESLQGTRFYEPTERGVEARIRERLRELDALRAKARRGEIKDFTSIDDPYEAPRHAEVTLDTQSATPEQNARKILQYLLEAGFVRAAAEEVAQ